MQRAASLQCATPTLQRTSNVTWQSHTVKQSTKRRRARRHQKRVDAYLLAGPVQEHTASNAAIPDESTRHLLATLRGKYGGSRTPRCALGIIEARAAAANQDAASKKKFAPSLLTQTVLEWLLGHSRTHLEPAQMADHWRTYNGFVAASLSRSYVHP